MTTTGTCLSFYATRPSIPTTATALERTCMGVDSKGVDVPFDTWVAAWNGPLSTGQTCQQLFNDEINSLNGVTVFNPTSFSKVSSEFEYMLSKYFNNNSSNPHQISLPGTPGYNNFQTTLLQACHDIPGACNAASAKLCKGCDRPSISNNADLIRLCGCYAPTLDPKIYTRAINVPCDPLCRQEISSKIRNVTSGSITGCNDSVCVIDNISITAVKSSVNSLSISQVCPGCGPGVQTTTTTTTTTGTGGTTAPIVAGAGCTCVIDASVLNLAASLGLNDANSQFQQYCPAASSTCIIIDSIKGTSTVIPCGSQFSGAAKPQFDSSIPTIVYIIIAIIVVIVLLALAAYIYAGKTNKVFVPRKLAFPETTTSTNLIK
jgi:hypothetical protein